MHTHVRVHGYAPTRTLRACTHLRVCARARGVYVGTRTSVHVHFYMYAYTRCVRVRAHQYMHVYVDACCVRLGAQHIRTHESHILVRVVCV